ncbi:hypothetical protein [Leptothoe sp. PORK10 BA2]|uniref:hypothetical protein n=1 Tax=Leptothoe sp. PORK10 BA2 TaxID=3110254 RepID=UPI002B20C6A2|nr:hypothetical protein [Leptothoe sp. PORK10 BA2]MEA5462128.1 hypothetical protein [Leptothoe sp. PORK10 BA2]
MTFLIIAIVAGLVIWALRLMDRALVSQEFSLMLAGFLVASSAAAIVGVYFLMGDYMMYMNQGEFTYQDQYSSEFIILNEQVSSDQLLDSGLLTFDLANLPE